MIKSSMEVANIVSKNANITETTPEYKFQWKKISRSARKRYHMLKEEGIPMEEARKLCRIDRSTLEHMHVLNPQKRNNPAAPQGPPNKTPKTSTEIDKQPLSSNNTGPLRVGITNSQSMSEEQMRMIHRHLLTAIIEQFSDGSGPVFLGFSHKAGWVLITCGNQRSKDWIVHEVPYLEPWPGARLSIIPDHELPKPPRAVTLIPDSEGVSVDEALKLFKVHNSDLNTELWKVRCEKVGKEGKTVYFTIDDPSADALRAQNCQAFLGSKTVTFKINGQYRAYTPQSTQNQVLATLGGSSKSSQAAGRDQIKTIQHQDFQPSAKKTSFAQGSGEITSWNKPSALAVGQSMSRPITQNNKSHGNTPLIQPRLGRPVIRESSISAKGLAAQATSRAAQQINQESRGHRETPLIQPSLRRPVIRESSISAKVLPPQAANKAAIQKNTNTQHIIQDSQSGRTLAEGRFGSAGETVFGVDGSVWANRGSSSERRSSGRVSPSHGGPYDRNRTKDLDKSSQGTRGGTYQAKNTYSSHVSHVRAFNLNEGVTARELTPGGFGARPIIQNPLSRRTPFTQKLLTESGQNGFSALARGKLSQVSDSPSVGRTLVQNGMEAATVSNQDGFLGQSQSRSGFGGRPIIRDSQLRRTISQDRSGKTDRTFDQGSALKTNKIPRSVVGAQIIQDPSNGEETFDQGRKVTKIDLTETDSVEDSPEAEGGYHTWVIEDLESSATGISPPATYRDQSYATQFAQGSTSTYRQMVLVTGLSPQGRVSNGAVIIGSESHGKPVYGCWTMTGQSRPDKGLLPDPSGSFESRTIEPESHGRPIHGSRTATGRDSRPEGLLSHPSGFEIEPESHGRAFQESRAMVTDRGSMSKRLSPQGRGSSGGRIQDTVPHGRLQVSKDTMTDRNSRSDRRLSPSARGRYGGRMDPEPHGRLQVSRGSLTDGDSRSDRRLSPLARGSYGGRQDPEPHGHFQGSNGKVTDGDSRSGRRLSPLVRGGHGGRQDLEPHGRFQGSKGTLTDRDSRSRRLSPLARDSYGGRQDLEPHGRFHGSKGSLIDPDLRSNRRLSPHARDSYGGRQDPETHKGPFQGSKRSLTDRDKSSDRLSPHVRGYSAWIIEEPQSGRGMNWDDSTGIPRARDEFRTCQEYLN